MADKKKVTPAEKSNGNNAEQKVAGAAKPSARKTAAKAKAETTEEKVEAVARKAKSTAKKIAAAVTGRVKEVAEKVGKTAKATTKKATTSATTKATVKKSVSAKANSDKTASSTTRAGKSTNRTKIGALDGDVTSADVNAGLDETLSSGDIRPESEIEDESATDVREHYFHDQHVHAGPPPPQPPRDVPDEYGDTKLVLLIRDPEWAYAYWEINDETRNQLNMPRNGHHHRQVLRIFKITGRQWPDEAAHYFFDVDVSNDARNWYLHMPEPDEVWCAELGLMDDEDNFITICRSNPIQTPRNSISEHVDSEWMTVEESFEKITRISSASLDAQLRGESYAGSESILRHIQRQLTGVLHGERAALSSGIFSSESPVALQNKDFWLQVHTELILYGATEPDAKVTVQGQPVVLNPDGTFSMRFALPDGEQILEVRAKNADGDMEESITPVVRRTTR